MGFFDSLQSGDVGGLLGRVGQGLADNTGLLYGLAAHGFAGANEGKASDRAAAAMRQKEQERALMGQALAKFAADRGIDPAYAQSEDVFKLWLDDEQKKRQLAMQEKNLQADIAYRNANLGMTERHYNDEKAYRDTQEARLRSAPIELDPYKDNYVRDPSTPGGFRRLDPGGGASPAVPASSPAAEDGGSFGGGSGVTPPSGSGPSPTATLQQRIAEARAQGLDPRTYIAALSKAAAAKAKGGAADAEASNPYAMGGNVDQGKAAAFASRAAAGHDLLNQYEASGLSRAQAAKSNVPFIGNSLTSADRQGFEQAERAFINAHLRRDSGAVISDSEFANARREFIPVPGDDAKTLEQKADARRTIVLGLMAEAPKGYRPPKGWENPETAGRSKGSAQNAVTSPFDRATIEAEMKRRGLLK